jgi:hypothetical protein
VSSFHDHFFSRLAAPQLLHYLGERLTYTPSGGSPKKIKARIHRQPPSSEHFSGSAEYAHKIEIAMADVPTINLGGDQVSFPNRVGDAEGQTFSVLVVLGQDGGMWLLGVG